MAHWMSAGLWPASLCSCSCDSCRASHGSASGWDSSRSSLRGESTNTLLRDGSCPHQQSTFNTSHSDNFDHTNFPPSCDGAGAGADPGLLVGMGAFDPQPYSQPSSYPQSITYDLNPLDGNFWPQGQAEDVSGNDVSNNTGGDLDMTPRNDYHNNQQYVKYSNGTGSNSLYNTDREPNGAGPSSGPRTSRGPNAEGYSRSSDDRIVTNKSRSRSSRPRPANNSIDRIEYVQKVIRDAETRLDHPHYRNSS